MVFSTNQVKQLYVAKALNSSLTTLGDIKFFSDADGGFYAKYVGNDGIVRTDLIKKDNLVYAKGIKASALSEKLDNAYVACSAAVPGQQYILRVNLDRFGGDSDEHKGIIMSEYVAKADDAVKNVLAGLAVSLAKNAAKAAYEPLIKVYVTTAASGSVAAGNSTLVTPSSDPATLASSSLVGIVIEAVEPTTILGKGSLELPKFSISTNIIISSSVETQWATVTMNANPLASTILDNKKIAELEWFCAGERGDIYRGVGYPNNFEFKPIAAATTYGYDIIELAYYYAGNCEDSQKSLKEIVIAIPAPSSYGSTATSYKILADINTAAGATVITQVFGS